MSVYNENRDNNMSLQDEIREQNAKMKGQPFSVKFSYFKEYYLKATIIITVVIIALISLIVSIVTGPQDTAFACYFINHANPSADTDTLLDDFIAQTDIDTKKYDVCLDTSVYYTPDNKDPYSYISYEKIMAIVGAGDLDVIVGDEETIEYYAYGGCFTDITPMLPDDLMNQFQDKLYYYTTDDGESVPIGIYINDSKQLAERGYYTDTPAVFCIIANSDRVNYAIDFLRFLYQ